MNHSKDTEIQRYREQLAASSHRGRLTSTHLDVDGAHGALSSEHEPGFLADVAAGDDIAIRGPHLSHRAAHAAELDDLLQVDTRVHHVFLEPQHVIAIEVLVLEEQFDKVQRHRRSAKRKLIYTRFPGCFTKTQVFEYKFNPSFYNNYKKLNYAN